MERYRRKCIERQFKFQINYICVYTYEYIRIWASSREFVDGFLAHFGYTERFEMIKIKIKNNNILRTRIILFRLLRR